MTHSDFHIFISEFILSSDFMSTPLGSFIMVETKKVTFMQALL